VPLEDETPLTLIRPSGRLDRAFAVNPIELRVLKKFSDDVRGKFGLDVKREHLTSRRFNDLTIDERSAKYPNARDASGTDAMLSPTIMEYSAARRCC